MCSVAEDDLDEERCMERCAPVPDVSEAVCNKCKGNADLTLRRKDFYCNACFAAAVVHKFRASFGKSKLVKPGADVLVAHSGSINSSALLHFLKAGLDEEVRKKPKFNVKVVHVDEGIIHKQSPDDRIARVSSIKSHVEALHFPFFSTSIGKLFADSDINDDFQIDNDADDSFMKMYAGMKDLSAQNDLVKKLKRKLLIKAAHELNCSFVLFADISQDLAVDSLVNISLGGGLHIVNDIGFTDDRDSVKILRPMREITLEELNHYVELKDVPHLTKQSLVNADNPYASIQTRIHHFVRDLEQNYPATVSTVVRTSSRVKNVLPTNEDEQCLLCQSFIDTLAEDCSTLEATNFSKEISTLSQDLEKNACIDSPNDTTSMCNKTDCCSSQKSSKPLDDIAQFLCHRCQITVGRVKNTNLLPQSLLARAKLRKNKLDMRNSIKDYLIE